MNSCNFFVRIIPSSGPCQVVCLGLPSYSVAKSAKEKLDNYVYKHKQLEYVFRAIMEGSWNYNKHKQKSDYQYQSYKQDQHNETWQEEGFNQDSSQSPLYGETYSCLDMQIEILRKQRLILQEEKKLLREQKKLDELKMKSFNYETPSVSNRTCDDVEMSEQSVKPLPKKFEPKKLSFFEATGVILRNMRWVMKSNSLPEERKALLYHMRHLLRQRLAQVIFADGRGIYQTSKVVMLYRKAHPPSGDEEFVQEAVKDVREGRGFLEGTKSGKGPTKSAYATSNS